ncbi:hypothetical protein BC829DRAFT_447974 [Chytridium lagenaria]|nr:hypothetical protein BC829DRAFT_447974 [Chytridium lagenaria]
MSQLGSTTGRKLPSGVGSEEEDGVEKPIEVGGSGSEAVQAVGGGLQAQNRPDGVGEFVSGIRRTVEASERSVLGATAAFKRRRTALGLRGLGLEDPDWSGLEAGLEVRETGLAAPSYREDQGVGDRGLGGGGEGSLLAGSRGCPQRMDGAGGTAGGGQQQVGQQVGVLAGVAGLPEGISAASVSEGRGGGRAVGRSWGGGSVHPGLVSQVTVPADVELSLDIRGALAGMTKAQVLEFVQSRNVVPLKKVILDVDGFSLAEDEVDPGLEFARFEGWLTVFRRFRAAALVFYPHRAKELDSFHDQILQTTTLYGWAAASVYEDPGACRMLAIGAGVVQRGGEEGSGGAYVEGHRNGVFLSGVARAGEALVGGGDTGDQAAGEGHRSAHLPRMVLPLTTVVPARLKILGIPAPAELPFTDSHRRVARCLVYQEGLTKLVTPIWGISASTLLAPGPSARVCPAGGIPEERHVVVSNNALAMAFRPTAADQLRVNSARRLHSVGVQKEGAPDGTVRFVHDFSFPRGGGLVSINGLTSRDYLGPCLLDRVDALLQMVAALLVGCILRMVDAKATYRQFPRREVDQLYQGVLLEGMLFVDHALMFGMRDAGTGGYGGQDHCAGPPRLRFVGYNLKLDVLFGTAIRVLGFVVDTRSRTVSLELSRRKEICKLLLEPVGSKIMTAQRVSVVAGTLTWVCQLLGTSPPQYFTRALNNVLTPPEDCLEYLHCLYTRLNRVNASSNL